MTLPEDLLRRIQNALTSEDVADDANLEGGPPEGAIATLRGVVPESVRQLYLLHLEFENEEGNFETYEEMLSSAYGYAHITAWNLFILGILHMLNEVDDPWIAIVRGWKLYELSEVPSDGDVLEAARRPRRGSHLSIAYSRPDH
jgi:hypothetical protein